MRHGLIDPDQRCDTPLRHNVKCTATDLIPARANLGRSLTQQAIASGGFAGRYGHSRFSKFVFGGASRYQLCHTMIPVLMSHAWNARGLTWIKAFAPTYADHAETTKPRGQRVHEHPAACGRHTRFPAGCTPR